METLLCRQPILDARLRTYGYELLYRACRTQTYDGQDPNAASLHVLATHLMSGAGPFSCDKVAFVNFTRDLLLNEVALLFPPRTLVVEILENVQADAAVIAACSRLKASGYRLALDDFAPGASASPLLDLAAILKVDFHATSPRERERLLVHCARPGLRMLAEKVETREDFEWARCRGFSYFQGYFFARPVIVARKEIPAFKVNLLRILGAVHAPAFEFAQIEELLKQEPQLCYRLLRYLNSPAFGLRAQVFSVRTAMALLGENELRKWLTLAALPGLASDKPDSLAETALFRARMCELLALGARLASRSGELFLMGMFSLLDAFIGRPLDELLAELGLSRDVTDALLGDAVPGNTPAQIYRLVLAVERADWATAAALAEPLGLSVEDVGRTSFEAAAWCTRLFSPPQAP